jgi:hypothetical protein
VSKKIWIGIAGFVLVAVGVVAFVASGSEVNGGTPGQRLADWAAATGLGQSVGTLHDDGVDLQKVLADHRGTGAVHTVCGVLSTDAESANSSLPSPDTTVTQLLAKAYSLEFDAGNDCYKAGATDQTLLAKSASERTEAATLFREVLARVRSVTGRTVSTTTTTQPTSTTGIF